MQRRRIEALTQQQMQSVGNNGGIIPVIPASLSMIPSDEINPLLGSHAISIENAIVGVASENEHHSSEDEDEDTGVLPRIGYKSDSSGAEEGEVKDSRGRKRIRPTGKNSFENCDEVLGNAYSIVHCYYKGPWRKWSRVPEEEKNIWWEEFKNRFFWKDKYTERVRRLWRAKCSQHIRSTLAEARKSGKRPDFIEPEFWLEMLRGWEQDDTFKHQSAVNKRIRVSEAPNGIGNYAGGSKPLVKYVAEYERKHGKRMSQEKLMHKGYKKKNGDWSSDRVRIALENYKTLCEKFNESHPEGITEKDAEKLWAEAAGGRKKGGLGSLRSSGSDFRNPSTAQRSSNLNISQMEELKKQLRSK